MTGLVHLQVGDQMANIGACMDRRDRAFEREHLDTQLAVAESEYMYLMEEAAKAMKERGRLQTQLQALVQTQASLAALPTNPPRAPALQVGVFSNAGQAYGCSEPFVKARC